jgi:hypothetical protein
VIRPAIGAQRRLIRRIQHDTASDRAPLVRMLPRVITPRRSIVLVCHAGEERSENGEVPAVAKIKGRMRRVAASLARPSPPGGPKMHSAGWRQAPWGLEPGEFLYLSTCVYWTLIGH